MGRYLVEPVRQSGKNWKSSNGYFENYGERSLGKSLVVCFLITYYILPQYFGIRLPGFDMTAQRFLITMLGVFLLSKESRKKVFWEGVHSCRLWPLMAVFLGICLYTAVFRGHIGTFLYPFIELFGAFLVIYALKEYLGSEGYLVLFRRMLLVLCLLGIVEAVLRKTPFACLETIKGLYTGGMIRSGSYRIMGPANHSLAYGLILISGLPLLCIDEQKRCFTVFRHLPLLVLVIVNVFLTGSRSTLAVMGLELLVLTLFAPGDQKKKLLLTVVPAGFLVLVLAFLFPSSPPGHYILLQLSTVVDEMFGTSYALRYGVDSLSLKNSASYREALLDIFSVDWLNPWLGQGSGYHFSWYIPGGATIRSIDNFYVANYIRYGYPGMIVYCLLILQAVYEMLRRGVCRRDRVAFCMALSVCGYFLNLWWMDTLQTIKYAYLPIALFQVYAGETGKNIEKGETDAKNSVAFRNDTVYRSRYLGTGSTQGNSGQI